MAQVVTRVVVALSAVYTLVFGVWMWGWPRSFAEYVDFPPHEHFLHDLGAFHLGIGIALVSALVWRDAIVVVLVGFATAGLIHAVNHAMDAHLGGAASDPYVIGAQTLVAVVGIVFRVRHLRARQAKKQVR
ncbi:hypothetical protein ACFFV7_49435 [Nonomuraea spiralis]|uniref:Uncharacterized protein n=1 Tax=Nonomuraea spiralis TaxID=46182 RepID=A0ABV5IXI7_9ACTN|nr:hypothetical protein [Nonomuraea spiralis]